MNKVYQLREIDGGTIKCMEVTSYTRGVYVIFGGRASGKTTLANTILADTRDELGIVISDYYDWSPCPRAYVLPSADFNGDLIDRIIKVTLKRKITLFIECIRWTDEITIAMNRLLTAKCDINIVINVITGEENGDVYIPKLDREYIRDIIVMKHSKCTDYICDTYSNLTRAQFAGVTKRCNFMFENKHYKQVCN